MKLFSWLPIIVPALTAWAITPWVIKIVKKLGLIDYPNNKAKAIHTTPLPRGGGLAAFVAISVALMIFLPVDKITLSIIVSLAVITIYGLADDKKDLNPYLRFLLQIGVATIPVLAGVRINFTTNPITQGVLTLGGSENLLLRALPFVFSVCWIVFLMNILNMGAKGIDGQLSGVVTVSALTIALLSQKYSADITQWPVIVLSLIVAGAYLGMIPWNAYPQKIMPSFSGSNIAGFMLGVLSILSTAKVGTLLVTLGIPIIDTFYVMTRRVLAGKSPVWGDKGHLHHRLLDLGIGKRQIAYLYWASTAILGMIALNLNATSKIYTIVGVAFFLGGLALFFEYAKNQKSGS